MNGYISVIVPCYNGANYSNLFISAIKKQTVGWECFEIIVVDNGSHNNSYGILIKMQTELPNLKVFRYHVKQSSYAARNFGVTQSVGHILAFTDIDCIPAPDWIENILKYENLINNNTLLSGAVQLFSKGNCWNIYEWYDRCTNLNQAKYSSKNVAATANLIMYRNIYDTVGGFDEVVSGGDHLFCKKAIEQGYKLEYFDNIVVYHPARNNLRSIIKKEQRIGLGKAQNFLRTNPNAMQCLRYVTRTLLALCIQLQQWKIIKTTWKAKVFKANTFVKFILTAFLFGFVGRASILKYLLQFLLGLNNEPIPKIRAKMEFRQ